jgi:hypothetical protein
MYIPKNKIKTGLIAGPNEFIDSNRNSYTGPYYKLASGVIQSGEYPGKGENKYLFPVGPLTPNPDDVPYVPPSLTTTPIPPLFPTPKDYEQGIFIRYFSKKRNEYLFDELTKDQYTTLNNTANPNYYVYKPFNIKWMITGSVQTVSNYNRWSVKSTEENTKVYGLDEYLKMNYTQYYK